MATGGIFQIITNDGKQDRMLMATALLHDRLDKIWRAKKALNPSYKDDAVEVLPSLIDIEKTHILFTNAHFKPFAAIGYEYNKVRATSGTPTLGSTLQFSIPQFGDFFHDIAFHCVLSQPVVTAGVGVAAQDTPAMRWCSWPGERLLKKVQQEVNGNPLDEYTFHATAVHREYRVAPNKLTAWKRCVGQEEAEEGFVRQRDWANSGAAADAFRVAANVHVGNQTPTASKTANLEMFIPLLFWYNKDVRLAVPSVAIPYGQRFINIELASASELVGMVPRGANLNNWAAPGGTMTDPTLVTAELYINNIFVNPEVHKIYIKRVGFSLIRVHRQQVMPMTSTDLHLQQLKWPIEYLFVGAKVRDYFAGSTDALRRQYLDVWDRYSVVTENSYASSGQVVMRESAFVDNPALTLGIAITTGVLTGTANLAQTVAVGDQVRIDGSLYTVAVGAAAGAAVTGVTVVPALPAAIAATVGIAAGSAVISHQGLEIQTKSFAPILDTISVQAHGIDLYKEFPAAFFNAYTTYHFGGPNINAPKDVGQLFVPFCLYPGTYQPSGHINVSRAREFYFKYTSSYQNNNPAVALLLVVIASAINFLLISDGSAVLRYST
jgi:hypothetical protein